MVQFATDHLGLIISNKNSQSTIQIITNDHGPDFSDKGVCNLAEFGQLNAIKKKDALA